MSNFKSHFVFTKEQRNGIFLLLLLIVVLQCVYFFVDFSSEDISVNETELKAYEAEIDSLRQAKTEASKPQIYPFNPNYITDYKGSTLGMSITEIDRLLAFRKQDQWINSAKQFQEVTGVSDSLLAAISPYFKFPEWVTNPKPKKNYSNNYYGSKLKSFAEKIDLNKATATQLQRVNGIGKTLSQRIIDYRERFNGGFVSDVQLQDIYGLSPEVIASITKHFTVKTPRNIKTFNLNTATVEELVNVQYIGYEEAYNIIEYRKLHEGFSSLDELRKVKDFPVSKLEIIKLSLHIQ
ncbi:helix-hairpin-helix domain-containing protein [Hyunsoonleella flava]|uniref:Helix-hairpin-helix domain-containing protein n=1 Tax=Hyunsoonleella flava TaxID=2527939 RepID=A0A4Q9FIF7_9FLAO|nr:helix-hairpin-helix domain-containing protein [Hyunsoonleella flava]TBN05643.1 helix-hairpin-helix domain-containing protein [Hyunsoonleella flava]